MDEVSSPGRRPPPRANTEMPPATQVVEATPSMAQPGTKESEHNPSPPTPNVRGEADVPMAEVTTSIVDDVNVDQRDPSMVHE